MAWFMTPHGPQSVVEPATIAEFRRRDYLEITAQQAADYFAGAAEIPDVSFITGQELPAAMAAAAADDDSPFAVELRATFGSAGDLVGFTSPALPKLRRAKARVRSGTADAKILCVGDSTTAGVGVNNGTVQGLPGAYPHQLAALLNAAGLPAARGLGIPGPNPGNEDSRWTPGAGWGHVGGLGWAQAADYQSSSGATSNLVYADTVLADRFDVYYLVGGGLGSFTATATGGSGAAQSTDGAPSIGKLTVSAASAATTNTVTITAGGTGNAHIIGVEPWLSTAKRVRVGNAGVGSSLAVQWAGNGVGAFWNSAACIKAYAPDLTIISLGLNDASNGQTTAAYLAAIDALVTAAQVSGDVILMPPIPPSSAADTNIKTNVPLYTAGLRSKGLPYADLPKRWTDGDTANGLGYLWDTIHPNQIGYADIAQMITSGLLSA